MQFGANGGSGTLNVSASRDCTWSVSAQAAWIAVGAEPNGNGDASLPYTIARNTVPAARSAELVVGSQHIQLSQSAAACTYTLDRSSASISATGGTLTVQLTTLTGCAWTASSETSWLTVAGSRSGTASSAVQVVVAENSGAARSSDVTIGGSRLTVTQEAAPNPAPAPGPSPTPDPSPTPAPTPDPSPTPTPSPTPISFMGTVSNVDGSCPALRFSLSGSTVTTDRDTRYSRGKCDDLSDGDTVTVDGMRQADGIVTAEGITINKNVK